MGLRIDQKWIFALFLLVLHCASKVVAATYTLEDLKILQNQRSFSEFFQHALDPRPSERDDKWNAMVYEMAEAWAKQISNQSKISKWDFDQIEALSKWPSLKEGEFFHKYRAQLGLKYLGQCLEEVSTSGPESCLIDMVQFWQNSPTNLELAEGFLELFDANKELYQNTLTQSTKLQNLPRLDEWDIAQQLSQGDYSLPYCKKPLVSKIMAHKALELSSQNPEKTNLMDKALRLFSAECLEIIHREIQNIYTKQSISRRLNAYHWLKTFRKIGQEEEWAFSVHYLLDQPRQGDQLNKAWNDLKSLGQSFSLRQKILPKLTSFDPLPDRLFLHPDEKLRSGIAKHLAQNFPEYFDTYARTCIQYLKGQGHFEQGNPTVNCTHFFSLAKKENLLGKALIDSFQKAKSLK